MAFSYINEECIHLNKITICSQNEDEMENEEEEAEEENSTGPDYNYLLSMPMWFLTKEKKEELCKQRDAKV